MFTQRADLVELSCRVSAEATWDRSKLWMNGLTLYEMLVFQFKVTLLNLPQYVRKPQICLPAAATLEPCYGFLNHSLHLCFVLRLSKHIWTVAGSAVRHSQIGLHQNTPQADT